MEKHFAQTDPAVLNFVEKVFRPEDPALAEIRERSVAEGLPAIQVGSMDALHLEVLVRMSGARKVVEIGTLGGYSGVSIARALPRGGMLYTIDADSKHTRVARESFERTGLIERVRLLTGPALQELPKIEGEGPFDLVFIDADKANYPNYLEWAWRHLRVGGAVIGDNTFAFGMIADTSFEDPEDREAVLALRDFNQRAAGSGRFRATILPTGEGMTLAVKLW